MNKDEYIVQQLRPGQQPRVKLIMCRAWLRYSDNVFWMLLAERRIYDLHRIAEKITNSPAVRVVPTKLAGLYNVDKRATDRLPGDDASRGCVLRRDGTAQSTSKASHRLSGCLIRKRRSRPTLVSAVNRTCRPAEAIRPRSREEVWERAAGGGSVGLAELARAAVRCGFNCKSTTAVSRARRLP